MKANSKLLIYDIDCPFCRWYTNQFVKSGMLLESERIPYNLAIENIALDFDRQRSKNKIALIDLNTKKVQYGIDSLLTILGDKFSWIKTVGKFPPVHLLLSLLYNFISYNRKVIAPSKCNTHCDCAPDKNYFWRVTFIVFCGLFVNFATGLFFSVHLNRFFIGDAFYTDLIFFGGQIIFQYVIFKLLRQSNFYDYAGQLSFVSFLGAILLLFFHIGLNWLNQAGIITEMLAPFCYGMVYLFMLYEHAKRIKILEMSAWLSISWIFYRFCIYPFAFQLFY